MSKVWPLVKLGEVLEKSQNWIELDAQQEYKEVTVRLWGKGVTLRGIVTGSQIAGSRRLKVHHDQFIVSRIDARNGAFGLIPEELENAVVSNDFPVFKINQSKLLPKYLHWLSKTKNFIESCKSVSEGTTNRVRLKEEKFIQIEIPLPPLAEQQRIVAKIERLAGKIEEGKALESKISVETELLWHCSLRKIRTKILNFSNYPKEKLGSLTKITAGGTPARDTQSYWNGNVPWIKTGELFDSDIKSAQEYITEIAVENSSAKIFPPDTILIALYGQGQTRGRTGRLMIPAATNQACCAILPNNSKLKPRYIQYWLRSLYLELREDAKGGAQPNWNSSIIKNIIIALPPLSEQNHIVKSLDDLQTKINNLKATQAQTAAMLHAMLPSILDQAFKGEL